jgi:DNA-binding beta-propeller fold protein YncE
VADNGGDNVSVISDSTNKVVANVVLFGTPTSLVYDPGKSEVFVDNFGTGFSVISDANNEVVANVALPAGGSVGAVAYDPAKGVVIAGNYMSNTISAVSDSSYKIVANVTVGKAPYDVAYDSGKGEVFVANSGDSSISVVPDAALSSTTSTTSTISTPTSSTSTTTAVSSPSSTASSVTSSTSTTAQSSTTSSTTSSTGGGGGVPEFPYQLLVAAFFTVVLAASYLLIRNRYHSDEQVKKPQ